MRFNSLHRDSLLLTVLLFLPVGCGSNPEPKEQEGQEKPAAECTEPGNPYSEGTGHYAGYEWAEEHGGNCNGRSTSFNEGCEEYEEQEAEYEACQSKKQ